MQSNFDGRSVAVFFLCESRELSIIIRHVDGQVILEISVRGVVKIALSDNLTAFAKKYAAYADFSQGDGNTSLLMYWADGGK